MAFRGRRENLTTSVVSNPPTLPVPMTDGTASFGVSFQGFPSATLEYKDISEQDITEFESAYNPKLGDRKVTIYGIDYIVDAYSYNCQNYVWRNSVRFSIFTVSIALKSAIEEKISKKVKVFEIVTYGAKNISLSAIASKAGITYDGPTALIPIPANADRNLSMSVDDVVANIAAVNGCYISYSNGFVSLKKLGSGGSWNFAIQEITSDGSNTLRRNNKGIKNAVLTWGEAEEEDTKSIPNSPASIPFTRKEPFTQTLVETDEDFSSPPAGTTVLKNLDSTSDKSSPSKIRKTTTIVNGVTMKEVVEIAKFEYTSEDIHAGDRLLFSSEPANFWKVVERQETTPVYKKISELQLHIQALSPDQSGATGLSPKTVPLILHPDYASFGTFDEDFGGGSFANNAEYLVEQKTSGWKRLRFEPEKGKETIEYGEDRAEDPYAQKMWKLYQYKQIPFESKTAYKLVSSELIYGKNNDSQPFTVEWKDYEELEPRLKQLVPYNTVHHSQFGKPTKVGVIYPDPNWAASMLVVTESKVNSAFAFTPDPNSEPDDPRPPETTGEESYYKTERTVITPNLYKEKITEFSTQNSGFSDLSEKISFKDVSGRLPEATVKKVDWEKNEAAKNEKAYNPPRTTTIYYASYNETSDFVEEGGSKSYPLAASESQAKTALETELRLEALQKDQAQKTIFTFYPAIRDGDSVVSGGDRFEGQWIVMSASWSLEFKGNNNAFGLSPLCIAQPTSVTLGLLPSISVSVTEKQVTDPSKPDVTGDPTLKVSGGTAEVIGDVLINSPNRRRF